MKVKRALQLKWVTRLVTRIGLAMVFAAALLFLPVATRADSTQTYNVTGTLASGGTITGQITIDFTTDVITTGPGGITADGESFFCPNSGETGCTLGASFPGTVAFELALSSTNYLVIDWNAFSSSNPPSTINLDPGYSYCINCGGLTGTDALVSGTAVSTPEPSDAALLLLGLGALGLMVRRRSIAIG